jgi:hypothetical protein
MSVSAAILIIGFDCHTITDYRQGVAWWFYWLAVMLMSTLYSNFSATEDGTEVVAGYSVR